MKTICQRATADLLNLKIQSDHLQQLANDYIAIHTDENNSLKDKNLFLLEFFNLRKELKQAINDVHLLMFIMKRDRHTEVFHDTREIIDNVRPYLNKDNLSNEELAKIYRYSSQVGNYREFINFFWGRDKKIDLAKIYSGNDKSRISLNSNEALSGNIAYHLGHILYEGEELPTGTRFPRIVEGALDLKNLKSIKDIELPYSIGGYLNLDGLTSAKGLDFPPSIRGEISLRGLTSAKDLTLPKFMNYSLYLSGLNSTEDLNLDGVTVLGTIYILRAPTEQKQRLKEKYPNLRFQ